MSNMEARIRALELKRQRLTPAMVAEALRKYAAGGVQPEDERIVRIVRQLEEAQALMLASVEDAPTDGSGLPLT